MSDNTPALSASRHADLLAGTQVSTEPLTRRGAVATAEAAVDGGET